MKMVLNKGQLKNEISLERDFNERRSIKIKLLNNY